MTTPEATARLIEVPRGALTEALTLTWPALLVVAEREGWPNRNTIHHCKAEHALLREGSDEMAGLPVLHYQRW